MKTILEQERLTLKKVAQRLDVHPATVWRWTLSGVRGRILRTIHIGGRRYVLQSDLTNFLDGKNSSGNTSHSREVKTRRANATARLDAEL
jgi:transcriptional regulator with XRE-family HTH domain